MHLKSDIEVRIKQDYYKNCYLEVRRIGYSGKTRKVVFPIWDCLSESTERRIQRLLRYCRLEIDCGPRWYAHKTGSLKTSIGNNMTIAFLNIELDNMRKALIQLSDLFDPAPTNTKDLHNLVKELVERN